jgi:hypothetical protein
LNAGRVYHAPVSTGFAHVLTIARQRNGREGTTVASGEEGAQATTGG